MMKINNKYKLQITDVEKYAREFWDNLTGDLSDNTASYITYMTNDCTELHNNMADALVVGNHWGFNCSIPKEDIIIHELNNTNLVKSYLYLEVWDALDKLKVSYKSDNSKITRGNINNYLEPLVDRATGKVVCKTNFSNIMYLIHIDLLDDYLNSYDSPFTFDCPTYLLNKANNKTFGIFCRYNYEKSCHAEV